MLKTCKHCDIEFSVHSRRKRQVGGYINECPDCVEERGGDQSAPKHFGVTGSFGEDVAVLRFENQQSREKFKKEYDDFLKSKR